MYLFFKRITFYINLISPIKWHFTDLIGIFSSRAIQIYKLVTKENKNSILDIIN